MFTKTKSSETPDLFFIKHLIEILLDEQRHQRADLATIKRQLHTLISDVGVQKQVDQYFEETSPQTERINNGDPDRN